MREFGEKRFSKSFGQREKKNVWLTMIMFASQAPQAANFEQQQQLATFARITSQEMSLSPAPQLGHEGAPSSLSHEAASAPQPLPSSLISSQQQQQQQQKEKRRHR